MELDLANYGEGDATFKAAGGEAGIRALVDAFYNRMKSDPRFATIWSWHPQSPAEQEVSRDKLTRFLCGWMGGPRRYHEKYGSISIPAVHGHLSVGSAERDQWLDCMATAIDTCGYPVELKEYLLTQLGFPADVIRRSN